MSQLLLKKWWAILLQGTLMIILSYFIVTNAEAVLAGVSLWMGLIILLIGGIGLIGWLMADKEERKVSAVIWSVLTALLGLVMLTHLFTTMRAVTLILGVWMLVTGYNLLAYGWPRRTDGWISWLMVVIGLLSILIALLIIINPAAGASWFSLVLGAQVFLSGLALIFLAFIRKSIAKASG